MKKMGKAGLALVIAGVLIFGAGYIGARGDVSVVNGSLGPMGVQLPATGSTKTTNGIGGGRNKPMTTPAPVPTPSPQIYTDSAQIYTDSGHHDEHEYERDGHEEQHHASTADYQSFPAEDVRKIELDINRADLVLRPSTDGNVYVSSDSLGDYRVSLDKSGTLTVESRNKVTFFGLNLTDERPTLTATLPESLCCSLEADVDCGNIQLEELSLDKLKLDSDMGDVYVYGVQCASADLSSSCGSVQALSVISSGKLEVESDMGDVTVENCAAGAELKVDSSCGRVMVNGCSAKSAELESDLGDVSAWWLSVTDRVKLDCDCGSIDFTGLTAGKSIEIDNSMGSIKGTLPGSITDYSIESGTDLGSNNLPSKLELGNIKLKAHADCGSIDIGFEDD